MKRPRTIKSFLKMALMIRDTPLSSLLGYQKLTKDESKALGGMTANVANDMSEPDFQSILNKY